MTGYVRQEAANIVNNEVADASQINNEYNAIVQAFAASTGHKHDGTAAEGGPIAKLLSNTLTFGAGTAGTDITFTLNGRPIFNQTGICKEPGQECFIGCQILWAPVEETINGKIVFERLTRPIRGLLRTPIECVVEKGRVTEIKGGTEAKTFERWLASFSSASLPLAKAWKIPGGGC